MMLENVLKVLDEALASKAFMEKYYFDECNKKDARIAELDKEVMLLRLALEEKENAD